MGEQKGRVDLPATLSVKRARLTLLKHRLGTGLDAWGQLYFSDKFEPLENGALSLR